VDWSDSIAPDLEAFAAMAEAARASLPAEIVAASAALVLRIEDWPSVEMLEGLDIETAYALTGLYEGIPLTEKSVMDQPHGPDMVWLFRRPILDEWVDRGNITLGHLITHVLVHEFAHHFGWSDADIAAIDPWWE
jgi:predicted Zn-dependent protease with MMP-like domain